VTMLILTWSFASTAAEFKSVETDQSVREVHAKREAEKNSESSPDAKSPQSRLLFEARLETTYNSNVFYFSRDEMDSFDTGSNSTGKFTDIDSIDDVILSPRFSVTFKDLFLGHTFMSGIVVTPHFYTQNEVKNYEDYQFNIRQYLSKGEFLEFDYEKTPEFMEGNFYDRDDTLYKKATYSEDRFTLAYNRPLSEDISIKAQYFYLMDDYNNNFNEYDMDSQALRLTIRKAFNEDLTGRLFGEYKYEDAQGDLGDTGRIESEPSREIWKINLRGIYDLTSQLQTYLQYGIWFIDYTTSHSVVDDSYHAQRNDVLQTIDWQAAYSVTKDVELNILYQYTIKDANPETDDLSILDASILGYEMQQVSVGMKYSF